MAKIDRLGWVVQDNYRFGERVVGMRFSSEPFADVVRSVLAAYETDEDVRPMLSAVFEPPAAASRARGIKKLNVLYDESTEVARTLSPRRLLQNVLRSFVRATAMDRDDHVYLACSAAVYDGSAALLPSVVGRTRDRLTAILARKGVSLIDGWLTPVDLASGRLMPLPEIASVPASVFESLAGLAPEPDRAERGLPDLPAERPVGAIAVWGRRDAEPIESITAASTLCVVASMSPNRTVVGSRILGLLAAVAGSARCFRVAPRDGAEDVLGEVLSDLAPTPRQPGGSRG